MLQRVHEKVRKDIQLQLAEALESLHLIRIGPIIDYVISTHSSMLDMFNANKAEIEKSRDNSLE